MATDFQLRQIFQKKFYNVIVPKMKNFEGERLKTLEKIKKFTIIARIVAYSFIAFFCLMFFAPIIGTNDTAMLIMGGIFILVFSCIAFFATRFVVYQIFSKEFEINVKKQIMPLVCSIFGDLKWTSEKFGDEPIFKKSGFLNRYTSSNYDDSFYGTFDSVSIEITEASFTYETGSGKSRTTHTEFGGVIIKFDMNKKFNSNTVILPEWVSNKPRHLKKTVLEDVEFEKKYQVLTNDEIEARYLITPSFMERLNNISKVFKSDSVRCAFYEGSFLLGLSTEKDLFKICDLNKPLDDREQFFEMFMQITAVMKLIKHFKLNQKIGL